MTRTTSVDTHPDALRVDLDVSALWAHAFPSPALVGAAAALLTPVPSSWSPGTWDPKRGPRPRRHTTSEGPRARLIVGPGAVVLSRTDPARAERLAARNREGAAKTADLLATDLMLEDRLRDADYDLAALCLRQAPNLPTGAQLVGAAEWSDHLADRIERRDAEDEGPDPARIVSWSAKSRANMCRTLAQLDYTPMFAGGSIPAMLTLTYPGDWEAVAPDAKTCKGHMDALAKRFKRAWGVPLLAVWKREFQRRGAPHYHLLMVPPAGFVGGKSFGQWVSSTWADVVAHPDPIERAKHVLAGTGIDYAEGMRAADPRRLAVYFSKHGAYGAKEYQNVAPALWVEAGSVGRFWGFWGLEKATRTVEVSPVEALAAARTMRRWQDANGYRVQREVWRTDTRTGVMRKRRSGSWSGARMRGAAGFVIVNDGAAFVSQLARYLDQSRERARTAELARLGHLDDRPGRVAGHTYGTAARAQERAVMVEMRKNARP